ncbi:class I SAM-dependent methyltransferase [Streptomyces tritici]|uniref:class I SAM-dependent methyltransferase n=1 Tax=Streptomyces tritici TaxID=2054410 RepID=UPI003AF1D73D
MTSPSQALSFDDAAALYAANRPSYPPALFDAVEELAGRPLAGACVADVGAGTGLATARLHARGARVVAVEPGPGMAAEFRRALPEVPVVLGDGNRLPLASASVDLVTYAQSWHWTDPRKSVPEALRVLRPGGALALWWNDSDVTVPWLADQDARVRARFGVDVRETDPLVRFRRLTTDLDFRTCQVAWSRSVPLDVHLANLASHSAFLMLGEPGTSAFLAAERELLSAEFPGGTVEERYVVSLGVARG